MKQIWIGYQQFLFAPIGTETLGIFRIAFALMVFQQLALGIAPDLLLWFGQNSIVPFDLVQLYSWQGEARFDLIPLTLNDTGLVIYFCSLILSSLLLALGLFCRFNAAYVAMGLISLHHHNPYIFNAGDNMMRLMAVFLAFSPCGSSYSLDAKFGLNGESQAKFFVPWTQRMIQIQMAIAYCGAFWVKAISPQWYDGTAVYYVTRLVDFMNGSFPLLDNFWFCHIAGWFTLLVELAAWTLIWIPRVRPFVLITLVLLHLAIDYLFNLPVFEFVFIAGLLTFVPPESMRIFIDKVLKFKTVPVGSKFGPLSENPATGRTQ